jgi:hypothetical protein
MFPWKNISAVLRISEEHWAIDLMHLDAIFKLLDLHLGARSNRTIYLLVCMFVCYFYHARDGAHGLIHARQVLYHCTTSPSPRTTPSTEAIDILNGIF